MSDTVIESFRTAVGGFHKGDVTNYIARTAAEFDRKLKEKESENSFLRQKNELLEAKLREHDSDAGAQQQGNEALQQKCEALAQENTALQQKCEALVQENTALQEKNERLSTQTAALQQESSEPEQGNAELAQENANLQVRMDTLQQEDAILRQENANLQAQLTLLQARLRASEQAAAELAAASAAEPVTESAEEAQDTELKDRELAAYRRAESCERLAMERARRISDEVETLFTDAVKNYTKTDERIQTLLDALEAQKAELGEIRTELNQSRNTAQQQFEAVCGREFFPLPKEEN